MGRQRWELERTIRVTGDEEVGIVDVRLVYGPERGGSYSSTHVEDEEHDGPGLVLDFDPQGRLLGIELLDPGRQLHPVLQPSCSRPADRR